MSTQASLTGYLTPEPVETDGSGVKEEQSNPDTTTDSEPDTHGVEQPVRWVDWHVLVEARDSNEHLELMDRTTGSVETGEASQTL